MELSAESIPSNTNIKLLLRHSIRNTDPKAYGPNELLLTKEGKQLAQFFGRNIQGNLGELFSSNYTRCIQTMENILIGFGYAKHINIEEYVLSSIITNNEQLSQPVIQELGIKRIVSLLANGKLIEGFNSIDFCVETIIDFIFRTGNIKGTLDIYCTHDIHIAMILVKLFGISKIDDIRENWPMMLEGIYLWGTIDDFFCSWRGEVKHFVNFKF